MELPYRGLDLISGEARLDLVHDIHQCFPTKGLTPPASISVRENDGGSQFEFLRGHSSKIREDTVNGFAVSANEVSAERAYGRRSLARRNQISALAMIRDHMYTLHRGKRV
jgi:hypothetical protein